MPKKPWCKRLKKPMIVWKKAVICGPAARKKIDYHSMMALALCLVKLRLPVGARVILRKDSSDLDNRKCRASRAKVLGFYPYRGQKELVGQFGSIRSKHDPRFCYFKGRVVKPTGKFDDSPFVCSSGIHFFVKRSDAVAYRI